MQQKTKVQKSKRVREQRTVGAIVFLIRHPDGECEVMSPDRKIYASGATLQQAFSRYYRKGLIAMRKSGKIEAAHPTEFPIPEHDNSEPELTEEIIVDETRDDDFQNV
jgi:hypothetical protein